MSTHEELDQITRTANGASVHRHDDISAKYVSSSKYRHASLTGTEADLLRHRTFFHILNQDTPICGQVKQKSQIRVDARATKT